MSVTLLTMLGILIAALGTVAGFVYLDMDSGSALEGGFLASEGITSLEQIATSYTSANGSRPSTLDDLKSVGSMPELPRFPGAAWAVGNDHVCLYGQHGTIADRSLDDAARRLGPKAVVSGECGGTVVRSTAVVLSYPIAS